MANKVLNRVWEHSQARGAARCLMLALADVADERGVAYPGVEYLAEMIRESADYTDVLIHKQIEAGELYKIAGRGRGHKTRFAILCGLSPDKQAQLKGVLRNPFSEPKKGYSKTPFGEDEKGVQKGEKRGTFRDSKQSRFDGSESEQTPIVETPDPMIQDHDPPPPATTTADTSQGGGGGGFENDPIYRLFTSRRYGIKAADRLSAWAGQDVETVRAVLEKMRDIEYDSNQPQHLGSRLYRALKAGPALVLADYAPKQGAAPPQPTRVPMPADLLPQQEAAARIVQLKAERDKQKREASHAPS